MKIHILQTKSVVMLIAALSLIIFSATAISDVAVIVNPDSRVSSLSKNDIKALFLGKKATFPNGNEALAVDQEDGSAPKAVFLKDVVNKNSSQLAAYWSQLIFSGKGTPPKTLKDDAAVKDYVASTPGAIGYVDSSAVDGSVTVVYTIK